MKRIAWFSPLTLKASSSAAYFTAQLLPALSQRFEVDLYTDDDSLLSLSEAKAEASERSSEFGNHSRIQHFHRAFLEHKKRPYDVVCYNFENSASARFVQLAAELIPGVGIFHDFSLNTLYLSEFAHSTAAKDYNELMEKHFGENTIPVGDYLVRGWSSEAFDYLYRFGAAAYENVVVPLCFFNESFAHLPEHARKEVVRLPTTSPFLASTSVSNSSAEKAESKDEFVCAAYVEQPLFSRYHSLASLPGLLRAYIPNFRLRCYVDEENREQAEEILQLSDGDASISLLVKGSIHEISDELSEVDLVLGVQGDPCRGPTPFLREARARGIPMIVNEQGVVAEFAKSQALEIPIGVGEERFVAACIKELQASASLRTHLAASSKQLLPEETVEQLAASFERNKESLQSSMKDSAEKLAEEQGSLISDSISESCSEEALREAAREFSWGSL